MHKGSGRYKKKIKKNQATDRPAAADKRWSMKIAYLSSAVLRGLAGRRVWMECVEKCVFHTVPLRRASTTITETDKSKAIFVHYRLSQSVRVTVIRSARKCAPADLRFSSCSIQSLSKISVLFKAFVCLNLFRDRHTENKLVKKKRKKKKRKKKK